MSQSLSEDIETILRMAVREPEDPLPTMEQYGRDQGFPIVGPEVGHTLRLLARCTRGRHAFEFGSGYGYSAAWLAGGLDETGEIILTEEDKEELDKAYEFLNDGPYDVTFHFEHGDAHEALERYTEDFDIVLIDHDKTLYVDAYEQVKSQLASDAVIVADNMLGGPVDPSSVRSALEGEDPEDEMVRGVANYINHVRNDQAVESVLLPLGEGIFVSRVVSQD
ncbi:MAG: O-methyltransferase [Halobacteriaceae archaeon]